MTALVAVLAGGRGRRMGAPKPLAELGGAPLIGRPLAAAGQAGLDAVVVAKAGTPLPAGLTVWHEPREPFHPLLGIVTALEREDSVWRTLEALAPTTIAWDDVAALRSVDTPEELAAAERELA